MDTSYASRIWYYKHIHPVQKWTKVHMCIHTHVHLVVLDRNLQTAQCPCWKIMHNVQSVRLFSNTFNSWSLKKCECKLFCPYWTSILQGSQALPACLSDKNVLKHQYTALAEWYKQYFKKNCTSTTLSITNLTWTGKWPVTSEQSHSTAFEVQISCNKYKVPNGE
jgi:hypothetical protein